jgi:hypothetical protein
MSDFDVGTYDTDTQCNCQEKKNYFHFDYSFTILIQGKILYVEGDEIQIDLIMI